MTELVYEPREDSQILQFQVETFAKGNVLDMGTGTGVQALTAAQKDNVNKVLAIDISKRAIDYAKKNNNHPKIIYQLGNLFNNVKNKFDTIIFNPPYLPQDYKIRRRALEGGKKGYEVIEQFLDKVNNFLNPEGIILLVFSSLSKKDKIDEIISNKLFEFKQLSTKSLFFETLYVYLITKSKILKDLETENIRDINFFMQGKRGKVFKGRYNNKIVCVKIKRESSEALDMIRNESKFIQKLNKHKIGPKYLFSDLDHLVYEFAQGKFIKDFLKISKKEETKKVFINVLKQCYIMDKLGINKEEMHHPTKHVIIGKKTVMIDFERCKFTEDPKNVSQFMQYIMMNIPLLKKKKINLDANKIISLTKQYKTEKSDKSFKKIIGLVKNC